VPTVSVHAYGFAGTIRPRDAATLFEPPAKVRVGKTIAVACLPDDRFVVVQDFGAIVFFGVDQAERDAYLAKLLEKLPPEPHAPFVDDFLLEVRPGEEPTATFDRAVVPTLDVALIEIIALVLAQSVGMDYYDLDIDELFQRVSALSTRLAEHGVLRGRPRVLTRIIGSILVTRNQIASTLSLLDAPAITWEREASDRLYRAMRVTFEIEDRYRAIQHKLETIQDNLQIIVDLVQHRRAQVLETIVIVLIAFEILMGLLSTLGIGGRH
jgi:uncharacterized Rmd1/YagE family protein